MTIRCLRVQTNIPPSQRSVHNNFSQSLPNLTHKRDQRNYMRKCLAFRPAPNLIKIHQHWSLVVGRRQPAHQTHLIVPAFIHIVSLILTCSAQMIRLSYFVRLLAFQEEMSGQTGGEDVSCVRNHYAQLSH